LVIFEPTCWLMGVFFWNSKLRVRSIRLMKNNC